MVVRKQPKRPVNGLRIMNIIKAIKQLFCKHCYLVEFKDWTDKDGISHVTRIERCSKCGHILYEKELK